MLAELSIQVFELTSRFLRGVSAGGLETIRLQNAHVSLTIVPAAGGKIRDLIDRRSGRNWLWRNPHVPLSQARREARFYREQDSGGWDEIVLSIAPGRIRKAGPGVEPVPDHGDVIGSQWRVDGLETNETGTVSCLMAAAGRAANYRFERRITLPAGERGFKLDYRLVNDGNEPLPAYWCAHPLLAVDGGARVQLDGRLPMRIDNLQTGLPVSLQARQFWPRLKYSDGSFIDLAEIFLPGGASGPFAGKVYVKSPASGGISVLCDGGSSRLTFRFDPGHTPWLGVWINNGKWSGCGSTPYTNLGIEPATSPYDSVNDAIDNHAVPWLAPGETRSWSLAVGLQA